MDTIGPDDRRRRTFGRARPGRGPHRLLVAPLASLGRLMATGCRSEMSDQAHYEPLEATTFFTNGSSARPLVEGTVAVGELRADTHLYEGKINGELADSFPFEITRKDLLRGQERFMIYCSPCHGAAGNGRGMVVQRGFPAPPPFYGQLPTADTSEAAVVYSDLREAPVGHFFDVMTNGHGAMYSYKSRVAVKDRWRIAAYIRALQLSQHATAGDLEAIENPNSEEQALLKEVSR